MKSLSLFRLIAMLAGGLLAASTVQAAIPPAAPGVTRIVWSYDSDPGPLNPHMYSPSQMYAQEMVYDSLVAYRPDGTVGPALARSWDISDDGRTYTFHLRPHVEFSDGSPLTAPVVKRNFDAIMANGARHAWLEMISQMKEWKALDDDTFQFTLKHSYYSTLDELSLTRPIRFLAPDGFPEGDRTSAGIKKPIGTGAWVLADYQPGEYALFKANPHWWGGKPDVDEVLVKVISDPTARALAFDTGEIDLIYGADQIDAETFRRYEATPGVVARLSAPGQSRMIAMNTTHGALKERLVRQAINHGVDRVEIAEKVFLGMVDPADRMFAPQVPYCASKFKTYDYSPEKAAGLLDQAGWKLDAGKTYRTRDGHELAVEFSYVGNDSFQKSLAEVLQASMKTIGVNMILRPEEQASLWKRQKSGDFDMVISDSWGAPYDPASYLSSMRAPSHADYQAQLGLAEKPELDRRITAVLLETDKTKIQAGYDWLLGVLHDEAVYLPICYLKNVLVYRSDKIDDMPFGALATQVPFGKIKLHK